ncbi:MAG: CPBP family intramembrane metalloprotease [Opitutaceae bacterium]|jgi:membrane protease YdiL (CAAX protease family)|nr:CPBP family intramembrane metalloprotease [Opitutaceae bacterium]
MPSPLPASFSLLQSVIFGLEIFLYCCGIGACAGCGWLVGRGLLPRRLAPWQADVTDFALGFLLVAAGAIGGELVLAGVGSRFTGDPDLQLLIGGAGFQAGMLAGVVLAAALIRRRIAEVASAAAGVAVPAAVGEIAAAGKRGSCSGGVARAVAQGVVTLAAAIPLVGLSSFAWEAVLKASGHAFAEQDLVSIFTRGGGPLLVAAMTFFAVVVAPLTEEIVFRAGLFRFLHRRMAPWVAMLVTSAAFASLHMNVAAFVPLCVLGMVLAFAYERTGNILVPVVAHALFNLNTIILLLAGLGSPSP